MAIAGKRDLLLFLDLETTGLDPEVTVPLEIGMVVVDLNLVKIAEFNRVIKTDPKHFEGMSEFCVKTHTASGLLEEALSSEFTIDVVEREAVEFVNMFFHNEPALLSGSSVHYDRGYIHRHFPELDKRLVYRHMDVSIFGEIFGRWCNEEIRKTNKAPDHRTLADIENSIETLRYYLRTCGIIDLKVHIYVNTAPITHS